MFCQVEGHWARNCNSSLRAKAQADRISKIPPVPFTTPATIPPQTATPSIPQPETTPTQSTSKGAPQQKEQVKATHTVPTTQHKNTQEKTPTNNKPPTQHTTN